MAHFLLVWVGAYFLPFSLVATKLPHYIAPAYPALALLAARFLVRWMRGDATPPRWVMPAGIVGVAATGLCVGVGLLVAGGAIPISAGKFRPFPGLDAWAWIGAVPILGAALMAVFLRRDDRPAVVLALASSTALFVGLVAAFPLEVIDRQKAAKELVERSGAQQLHRDTRVGSLEFSQPSLTYYVGRKVERLVVPVDVPDAGRDGYAARMAASFLDRPEPTYLFLPEPTWRKVEAAIRATVGGELRETASKYDFTRNAVIVAVWNGR